MLVERFRGEKDKWIFGCSFILILVFEFFCVIGGRDRVLVSEVIFVAIFSFDRLLEIE